MNRNVFRYITLGLITCILAALQSSNSLALLEINPDFLMVLVILYSLHYGEYKGIFFSFGVGLLEDTLSGSLFGLNAFVLVLIGWLTSVYKKYIFMSDILAFFIYVLLATILKYMLYLLFGWIFQKPEIVGWFMLLKMAGEIAYNILIGTLFFYVVPFLFKKEQNPF
jgi:rod shape-determining protein MreD